jgi:hypothetical protein
MKEAQDSLQLRQAGKGFIIKHEEGFTGRTLTQSYRDQYDRAYIKVNGEITPLTDQHGYLAVD